MAQNACPRSRQISRHHDAAFKARVALEVLEGERTVSEWATACEVHPTMIHQWSEPLCAIGSRTMASALLEGAAGIFELGGKVAAAVGIAENTVRDLHAKIVR